MTNPLKRFPIWLALGLVLAGCGGDAGTTVAPQSSYNTTSPYTDTVYTSPYPNTGSTGNTGYTGNTGIGDYLPVASESAPVTTPTAPVKSGVEVQLVSKDLPGMFSWERCEAKITVTNHDSTPQQGFLIVTFTLKGSDAELQYRALNLSAKGSQTFTMKSTVRADDVSLAYRTKLL